MSGETNSTATTDSSYHQDAWELVAVGDWLAGQRFEISRHAVLGRDSSCDITIPGTHLSRHHAELAVKGGALLIRDLQSSNGTWVNEKRVAETSLKPGDLVRFDVLKFKVHGPSTEQPANAVDTKANKIRRPDARQAPKKPRQPPVEKKWKTKPTAVGNRDKTIHMTAVQQKANRFWTLLSIVALLGTVAGIGYLLTYI